MYTDGRRRESRGSVDWHVSHAHAMTGTPCDVPVPRKVIFIQLQIADCRLPIALSIADLRLSTGLQFGEWIADWRLGSGLGIAESPIPIRQSTPQSAIQSPIPNRQSPIQSAICSRQSAIVRALLFCVPPAGPGRTGAEARRGGRRRAWFRRRRDCRASFPGASR